MNYATNLPWRRIFPFMVLALLMSAGVYWLAEVTAPADMVFTGALVNHNDVSSYLAAMRQGGEGRWLFNIQFSPETWRPVLMLPMYMIAGKVLPAVSGSYRPAYDFLRIAGVLLTGVALFIWLRHVFPGRPRHQMSGWLLIIFGSGIGWLVYRRERCVRRRHEPRTLT